MSRYKRKCAHPFTSWHRWESSRGAWMVYECHHCGRWLATKKIELDSGGSSTPQGAAK